MLSEILHTLSVTWGGYFGAARAFLPQLVCASSVIAVGWLIAAAARFVTARVLRWIRFSHVSERTGAAELLRQAELPPAERLVPSLVFWLLFLGFLLSGIDGLGFQTIQVLREQATLFVPRLVGAAAIVSVGLLLASFVGRLVLLATCNAGWRYCRLASRAVQGFFDRHHGRDGSRPATRGALGRPHDLRDRVRRGHARLRRRTGRRLSSAAAAHARRDGGASAVPAAGIRVAHLRLRPTKHYGAKGAAPEGRGERPSGCRDPRRLGR